jgi:hypothetical protein
MNNSLWYTRRVSPILNEQCQDPRIKQRFGRNTKNNVPKLFIYNPVTQIWLPIPTLESLSVGCVCGGKSCI